MDFKIGLAGRTVGVTSIYNEVYELCRDYIINVENEDFHVTTSENDIDFERVKSIREAIYEGIEPVDYERPYCETLAVYRKIAVEMLKYDTWLMHGAVVGVNDSCGDVGDADVSGDVGASCDKASDAIADCQAVLFTAQSGVGKTTHMNLWLKHIPGAFVINGDKPLLRFVKDDSCDNRDNGCDSEHIGVRCEVCGTPWAGKEALQTNVISPLKAICFIERGDTNEIERVAFEDVYPMLLQQVYRPSDPQAMMKTMELVKKLGTAIPLYRMKCTMEPEAAQVAYEGMMR